MTKLLSQIDYYRLICNGRELLMEESYSSDCAGNRRWLPSQRPYDTDFMNELLKQAIINNYTAGRRSGVVFCAQVNTTESVRIVLQPARIHTYSECIESSSARDGLGEQIWNDVEDCSTQNDMMGAVLLRLCAEG